MIMAPAVEKQTQKAKKVKGSPILVNASRVLRSMPFLSGSCKSDFKFAEISRFITIHIHNFGKSDSMALQNLAVLKF